MIGWKLVKRFWVFVISPSRPRLILTGVRKVKSPSQAFVFRLSHKQILNMTMKLLVDNNKTLSWNKTIIDFGVGCYLVYQPLKTYIHLPYSSVNITFFSGWSIQIATYSKVNNCIIVYHYWMKYNTKRDVRMTRMKDKNTITGWNTTLTRCTND
jgi:hypothetical protein